MTRKNPRPYQIAVNLSLWEWLNSPKPLGNPLVIAPVGMGKSYMIARFIREVHELYPRTRILCLAHVKELLLQNAEELVREYPECDFDFYCAGLGRKRLNNDVTFASIQSLYSKITQFNRCPEVIIIDEAHLISHDDQTQYRKLFDAILAINPNAKFIGYTGSGFRVDTGLLHEGEGKLFDGVAYEISIKWAIEQGYLVRPIIPDIKTHFNIEGVKMRGGDFIANQLQKAVDIDEVTQACVDEVMRFAGERKRWFGMTAGVLHCVHTRDAFRHRGIDCEMITRETPDEERKAIIDWFKAVPQPGESPRCLVNVGTMNVGFNAVYIDLLFPMRPTRSPVLYIQYTGRGLRPVYAEGFDLETQAGRLAAIAASSKPNVMFLDFGEIISYLGPIDTVTVSKKNKITEPKEEKEAAPHKVCPACGTICATAQKICYNCSYHFAANSVAPIVEKMHAVLSRDEKPKEVKVMFVEYKKHYKGNDQTKTPTMMVQYCTTSGNFREYICFEHIGFPRRRAEAWFWDRLPGNEMPSTVDEGLLYAKYYPNPTKIMVKRTSANYHEVVSYDFTPIENEAAPEGEIIPEPEKIVQAQEEDFVSVLG